ncbi:MAG: NUDIX hydrolase [Candidatus Omnitrophica bacterium]|nr:NUDIX hydrolase [Candidatus Omnitrophota bacterium]
MSKRKSKANKKILVEGRFLRFVKTADWEYVERINCSDIVIIVAMTEDEKVILVEQYRPPVKKFVIEFPAGLINDQPSRKHESIMAGAKRELLEETGYRAKKMVKITDGPTSGGSSADIVTIFRAYGLEKVGQGGGDETEAIKIHEVPIRNIDRWLQNQGKKGRLIEPKIYTGLYFLKNYNKFSRKK